MEYKVFQRVGFHIQIISNALREPPGTGGLALLVVGRIFRTRGSDVYANTECTTGHSFTSLLASHCPLVTNAFVTAFGTCLIGPVPILRCRRLLDTSNASI